MTNALTMRRTLIALLALALARGVLYTFAVPPWQHPDEPGHFEHARVIAETGRLPDMYFVSLPLRREIADSMLRHGFWRGIEQPPLNDDTLSAVGASAIGLYAFTKPRLYYLLGAIWLRPWLGQPVDFQLYALRLLAVALNLLVVGCVLSIARQALPGRPGLAAAAAGFVVFQPMHTDIMSAANNDALANALAAMFYLGVAQVYRGSRPWRAALLCLFALAAEFATKATSLIVAATAPLSLVFYPWRRWLWPGLIACLLSASLGLSLVAVIMSGQAEALLAQASAVFGRYTSVFVEDTLRAIVSPDRRAIYGQSAGIVFQSFWAAFGWRHVVLPGGWYWAPGLAMLAAAAGLATQAVRALRQRRGWTRDDYATSGYLLFSLGAVIVAWVAALVRSQALQGIWQYHSHGRYAFVAMAPFALLMAAGLLGWLPEAKQRRAFWIFLAAWAAFDALAFWGALVPYYFPR